VTACRTPLAVLGLALALPACAQDVAGTKLPYAPRQDPATYEAVPAGFVPVHTQLVARHGARGLTGMKSELALLNLCRQARAARALTPLGARLAADLEGLIRANALLGAGVDGVARPGYGNLSLTGIDEHRGLAQRAAARLPALFADPDSRTVLVEHSGVDRARDSAAVFTAALLRARPALAPAVRDGGANRWTLYFHKLKPKTDGAPPQAWQDDVLRASLAYQAYLDSDVLADRLAAVHAGPRLDATARAVLARLFAPAFLKRLQQGGIRAANTGRFTFTSRDGRFTTSVEGDGKSVVDSPAAALEALADAHDIAPSLARELQAAGVGDFSAYLAPAEARYLAAAKDAEDFYEKGPGIAEQDGVTWRMAQGLVDEFFRELDDEGTLAHFRFTHAEIVIPFAAALGLPGKSEPLPLARPYSHAASPWRSADVAPYAANVQWDSFRDAAGRHAVRMLYDEAETDFKPACDGARLAPGSHFYDVAGLRACYGQPR